MFYILEYLEYLVILGKLEIVEYLEILGKLEIIECSIFW
jgi:hypothetical protein